MASDAHSRNLRLHRLKDVSATFFITKSLQPKKPILNRQATELIVSAFAFAVQKQRIYLRAFVVMPDHWHALFALREPWTLPKFMHDLVSYIAGKTSNVVTRHKTSWQDGYYDTVVKTARQFEYVAYYIEQNPVGLAFEAVLITLIFIVISYAALAAACASEMSADSKLRL